MVFFVRMEANPKEGKKKKKKTEPRSSYIST